MCGLHEDRLPAGIETIREEEIIISEPGTEMMDAEAGNEIDIPEQAVEAPTRNLATAGENQKLTQLAPIRNQTETNSMLNEENVIHQEAPIRNPWRKVYMNNPNRNKENIKVLYSNIDTMSNKLKMLETAVEIHNPDIIALT